MQGMTERACPVCATPYAAGATSCAFCGVSLLEPEAQAPAPAKTSIAPGVAAETDAPSGTGALAEPAPEPAASAIDETDGIVELDELVDIQAASTDAAEPDAAEVIDDDAFVEARTDATADATADGEASVAPENAENPDIPADSAPAASAAAAEPHAKTPSFAKAPTTASAAQRRAQRIEWGVVGGLAVLLLVQVVASDFDQLAAGSATRPWLQRACSVLRCTLPPWREPRALRMLQRDVRANPERPGLLRVSASFRNEARWAQPWPRLRIVLSDADGRAIAARDFAAGEYLGATPTANGIASGQVAGIAFDVVDPSPHVTAFTFEFR
jgi:hypothetical protein